MGGGGWTVLGGWWDLCFGGGALAGSVRLCGCVCDCVYQRKEEEDDESELILQMEKRERERERERKKRKKKGAKREINKIIGYTSTVTVYICTITVANV